MLGRVMSKPGLYAQRGDQGRGRGGAVGFPTDLVAVRRLRTDGLRVVSPYA